MLAGAPQQISCRPLAAGEYVKLPDENVGAFWPVLEFSVPVCNLKEFSTLAVVENTIALPSSHTNYCMHLQQRY